MWRALLSSLPRHGRPAIIRVGGGRLPLAGLPLPTRSSRDIPSPPPIAATLFCTARRLYRNPRRNAEKPSFRPFMRLATFRDMRQKFMSGLQELKRKAMAKLKLQLKAKERSEHQKIIARRELEGRKAQKNLAETKFLAKKRLVMYQRKIFLLKRSEHQKIIARRKVEGRKAQKMLSMLRQKIIRRQRLEHQRALMRRKLEDQKSKKSLARHHQKVALVLRALKAAKQRLQSVRQRRRETAAILARQSKAVAASSTPQATKSPVANPAPLKSTATAEEGESSPSFSKEEWLGKHGKVNSKDFFTDFFANLGAPEEAPPPSKTLTDAAPDAEVRLVQEEVVLQEEVTSSPKEETQRPSLSVGGAVGGGGEGVGSGDALVERSEATDAPQAGTALREERDAGEDGEQWHRQWWK